MDKFQQADHDWLQCMERIGRKELACFEEYSVGYTDQIVTMTCRRGIMVWVYNTLKAAKKIKPIEELEIEDKKQMWAFINELCAGKTDDRKVKIEVAKVFYVIEYFIKEQNQKTNENPS
jgi:hypothetical protein